MNILAVDTATEACSVAVKVNSQVFVNYAVCPQQHSAKLLPMVEDTLQQAELKLADIHSVAFGKGPGSFTGVRIATSMAQGLAYGNKVPLLPCSTLQALAQQAVTQQQSQYVAVAIDARMSEIYFALFKNEQGLATLLGDEQVIAPNTAIQQLQGNGHWTAVGSGWEVYSALNELTNVSRSDILYPNAEYMLPMSEQLIELKQTIDPKQVNPTYLRDKVTWKKLPDRE
jgi:tRNA threonylcarbamoyladenosine biosynthesis protein TsaB